MRQSELDPGSTSPSLIVEAQSHDAVAWNRICAIYGPLIYYWIRRAGIPEFDAADIGQEVLLTLLRRLPDFDAADEGSTFRGWLRVIVRNKVGDRIRRRRGTPGPLPEVAHPIAPDDSTGESDPGVERILLRKALHALEPEFEPHNWQAFWQTVVLDRESSVVAEELGMSSAAVRQARCRILRRLRNFMQEESF